MSLELPILSDSPSIDMTGRPKGKYCFVSLGCPKNLVDSEKMLGQLAVDRTTMGMGLGKHLRLDALNRSLAHAHQIAAMAVVVSP